MSGIPIEGPEYGQTPTQVSTVVADYKRTTGALLKEVEQWSDANLEDPITFFGQPMSKGMLLTTIITHQAHHRGQLTVLMHEAGTPSSGFYGPTAIEQRAKGQEPLA